MEVLTLILKRKVRLSDSFCYHKHCEELQLINVCFADDLFIFARGDVDSAWIIMEALDEFKGSSGLVPSIPKSTGFFFNVANHVKNFFWVKGYPGKVNHVKNSILNIMPFAKGFLTSSTKLKKNDKDDLEVRDLIEDDASQEGLVSKIKNIEGKVIGKGGNLRKPVRDDTSIKSDGTNESVKGTIDVTPINAAAINVKVGAVKESNGEVVANNSNVGAAEKEHTKGSFASMVQPVEKKLNFRAFVNDIKASDYDCVLPQVAMEKVKGRYENSIVGYFLGKDIAFQVVQNYVTNTWSKFGFQKITRTDEGVYLFKFTSKSGMEQALEKGLWIIRKSPLILTKWSPFVSLRKGEVTKVPVWVKLHGVPVLAYLDDGLSLIVTQIGNHIMLDAFTSTMCVESWGRISYARALIEVNSESVLKKQVSIGIPNDKGDEYIKEVIRVEYEWMPPQCEDCKVFGHCTNQCPKRPKENTTAVDVGSSRSNPIEDQGDGFVVVKNRKKKGESSRSFGGLRLLNQNSKIIWQKKKNVGSKGGSNSTYPNGSTNDTVKSDGSKATVNDNQPKKKMGENEKASTSQPSGVKSTPISNPFSVLNSEDGADCGDTVPTNVENTQYPKIGTEEGVSETYENSLWSKFKAQKGGLKEKARTSVISSMQVYWASVLAIPKGIILDIHQLIRGFLWCNGEYKCGKAKVAWSDICLPKSEGGLSLRSLEIFNMALMTTHIWNIVPNKESLWLCDLVRPFIRVNLGNGRNTSIWFDNWCSYCPLIRFLTCRDISREGFSIQDCVIDLVLNDGLKWPQSWFLKAPDLGLVPVSNLVANKSDVPRWQNRYGSFSDFSVRNVWETIRPRRDEVDWFRIVWFSHCVPRHAFHLWLVMRRSLKTKDNLRP
ncbi:reverse transcriptase domain-containing protein [Tanacetum coccineum]